MIDKQIDRQIDRWTDICMYIQAELSEVMVDRQTDERHIHSKNKL